MCSQKYLYKGKIRLKTERFLLKTGFMNHVFARTLMTFGFTCRIISVKLLVFGVKMLPQKKYFLLLKFVNNNAQFITTNHK